MQITISGHHLEVTAALDDYVRGKLERLARRTSTIISIHVTLSVEKQLKTAEANIHVTGANFAATADHDDMYAAIDLLIDKLDSQLRRHKEKSLSH